VASAKLDLDYAFVRAPISGRIGRTFVTAGNLVGPNISTPLTTIVSVDPLYVYVDVDEGSALRFGRAMGTAAATANIGFADEAGHPHSGAIDFVDNRVDPQTGTMKVRVVVKNEGGRLTPGLFARIQLPAAEAHDTVLVADRAVGTDQDRRYVYVLDREDKVQYRLVKLGPLHDGLRVVREGLAASDRVVVVGLQRVRPGVQVTADLVPMTAPSAAPGALGGAR
jgi:RND family efflux transporter MFP subunit